MLISQKVSCGEEDSFRKSARFNSEASVPASHFLGYSDSKKGF